VGGNAVGLAVGDLVGLRVGDAVSVHVGPVQRAEQSQVKEEDLSVHVPPFAHGVKNSHFPISISQVAPL
jgi:hypothetical protein